MIFTTQGVILARVIYPCIFMTVFVSVHCPDLSLSNATIFFTYFF